MKIFLVLVALATISVMAMGNETGSLYASKIDSRFSWEGNPTGATINSVFTLVIDGETKAQISKDKDATINNLELGKRHSVAIYLDDKKIASFYFKFEDYKGNRLWLYYRTMYGDWILRESRSVSKQGKAPSWIPDPPLQLSQQIGRTTCSTFSHHINRDAVGICRLEFPPGLKDIESLFNQDNNSDSIDPCTQRGMEI
jgi:hypothetical protein